MTTCPGCEQEVYADLLDDGDRLRCRSCGATDEPAAFQDPLPAEDRVLTDGGTAAVDLSALTEDVGEWAAENFGDRSDILRSVSKRHKHGSEGADLGALFCTLGVNEEAGELTHSVLKRAQGIRLDEEDVGAAAEMDAVGDIVVYLADFCYRRGFDLEECVRRAWDGEVSDREWDTETRADSGGSA